MYNTATSYVYRRKFLPPSWFAVAPIASSAKSFVAACGCDAMSVVR